MTLGRDHARFTAHHLLSGACFLPNICSSHQGRLQTCFATAGLKSQGTHYIYPGNETWAKSSPVVPKLEHASESAESLLKHTLQGPSPRVSDSGSLGWGRDWEFAFLRSSQVELLRIIQGQHLENLQPVDQALAGCNSKLHFIIGTVFLPLRQVTLFLSSSEVT